MYDPVLLTLDGSDLAEKAIPYAVELARAANARLFILRVVPPLMLPAEYPYGLGDPVGYQKLLDAEQADCNDYLKRTQERLAAENPGLMVEAVSGFGAPAEVILEQLDKIGAQVIVMATHGRSGLGRWVFGSVADRILHAAPVPVLLVRAGQAAKTNGKKAEVTVV